MIYYTDEERSNLYDMVIHRYAIQHVRSLDADGEGYISITQIVIQGETCRIQTQMLSNIIYYDHIVYPDLYKYLDSNFSMLHTLINFEPLIRVPLYINKIPEIVAWRLRVGK